VNDRRTWHVYLLECSDGTLYTGVSVDPGHRLQTHNAGRGARYTRTRLPVRLLASKAAGSCGDALKLEKHIKRMLPARKRAFFDLS
jgi:putative endonuclease